VGYSISRPDSEPAHTALGAQSTSVLLLSMREMAKLVGYCALYEFEDVLSGLVDADVLAPASLNSLEFSRRAYRLTRYLTGSRHLAHSLRPRLGEVGLTTDYELFLPVFNHPHELFTLTAARGWRKRSRLAACYLCEAWDGRLPGYLLELLRDFDHVFVGVKSAVESISRITRRPCSYLPMGVDALRFCPYPLLPNRAIDVCGIGRRSGVTHAALLDWARRADLFYYYDTMQYSHNAIFGRQFTFHVNNPREHRLLLASLLKRTRYFIANRAWANLTTWTGGADEIPARFYEGTAAGAILLGDPPRTDDFRAQFAWPDAIVPMPFDAPDVAGVIAQLDADPARTARIRTDNVVNALLRHDWVYRVRSILETLGLPPTPGVVAREERLRALAEVVRSSPGATF
jgi:hypothetical protein